MKTRWSCTKNDDCPAVLGPTRPRKDDVCRFCLPCSAKAGKLVPRVAPALEAKREKRAEKMKAKKLAKHAKTLAEEAAYYNVHGVDLREELERLWNLPVAREYRKKLGHLGKRLPELVVRTRSTSRVRRYGVAYSFRHQILINRIPGLDGFNVRETLAHEVAHILSPGKGHGVGWKTCFRLLCEQAFDVRPIIDKRYHGHVHHVLRDRAKKALEGEQERANKALHAEQLAEIRTIAHRSAADGPKADEPAATPSSLAPNVICTTAATLTITDISSQNEEPAHDIDEPPSVEDPGPGGHVPSSPKCPTCEAGDGEECPRCGGHGVLVVGADPEEPCPKCGGHGHL